MKPIKTSDTNGTLKAPEGTNKIYDLPVTLIQFQGGKVCIESCWALTNDEIDVIKKTKKLYIVVLGTQHPPITPMIMSAEVENDVKS